MRENRREEVWWKPPSFRSFWARLLMQFQVVSPPLACRSPMEWKRDWILGVFVNKLELKKTRFQEKSSKYSLIWVYGIGKQSWGKVLLWFWANALQFIGQGNDFHTFPNLNKNWVILVHGCISRPKKWLKSTQIRVKWLLKSSHEAM